MTTENPAAQQIPQRSPTIQSSERTRQPTEPSQAGTSRHSKLNRKSGYHLPHKARSTPAT
jgi:hypothetical protein